MWMLLPILGLIVTSLLCDMREDQDIPSLWEAARFICLIWVMFNIIIEVVL